MTDEIPSEALALCAGFNRVQVNATRYDYARIERFAEQVKCDAVIVQHRGPFQMEMPLQHPKVDYLYDRSGGTGKTRFGQWPPPSNPAIRHGYAGGISPDNIHEALRFASGHPGFRIWLDMETGVRDGQDRFDLSKAQKVAAAVFSSPGMVC